MDFSSWEHSHDLWAVRPHFISLVVQEQKGDEEKEALREQKDIMLLFIIIDDAELAARQARPS